jgi:pimeloyl-ACP methyl ester carboxylesterase
VLGTVVLMPGLGLPRYTRPTAEALAARGLRCVVLDVLASRRDRPRVPPDIESLGRAAARWVRASMIEGPLVLFGHSTGAQAALAAALELQPAVPSLRVVLAGPTFQPAHRTVGGLARAGATAYRRDSPRELVVLRNLARVRTDVVRIIRSAQRDRPEERIAGLYAPLLLTAGEYDTFAPLEWMQRLAAASGSASGRSAPAAPRVVQLPGSHNNLFTHPAEIAAEVAGWANLSGEPGQR